MSTLQTLRLFVTPEHSCSYLPNHQATTLFVDPQAQVSPEVYSELTEMGFRRSGTHIYRPHCKGCQECISVRIPAAEFRRSKSQRRIWNRNQDLRISTESPKLTEEIYGLYERYIRERHADGDMYPPTPSQFQSFLVESLQQTSFHLFRNELGKLVGVAVTDRLKNGLSAVYTFYDPDEERRSLGTFAVLWQLEELNRSGLDYLYLGYWVRECRKMEYKKHFQPLEQLHNGVWIGSEQLQQLIALANL